MKKKNYLYLALFSTLIAIGLHFYLTQQHYGLKFGTQSGPSVCNLSATFNCDAVALSNYSSLLGIPMALYGFTANLVLFLFIGVAALRFSSEPEKIGRYSFYFSLFILAMSVVMGVISLTALKTYCLFCIGTYVMSIIGAGSLWLAQDKHPFKHLGHDIKDAFGEFKWIAVFIVAIPALAFMGNKMVLESHGYGNLDPLIAESVSYWKTNKEQSFDLSKGLVLYRGTGTPKMTIVEFADFRCPHCKHAAPTLHSFVDAHPDAQLIFKPFPLDGTCNSAITNGGDGISCKLSHAVFCAEKMAQKGWAAHDHFFENQENLRGGGADNEIANFAEKAGIKQLDFEACIKSPEIQDLIRAMAEEGKNAQVEGTPSVYVNNRKLDRGQVMPVLKAVHAEIK